MIRERDEFCPDRSHSKTHFLPGKIQRPLIYPAGAIALPERDTTAPAMFDNSRGLRGLCSREGVQMPHVRVRGTGTRTRGGGRPPTGRRPTAGHNRAVATCNIQVSSIAAVIPQDL